MDKFSRKIRTHFLFTARHLPVAVLIMGAATLISWILFYLNENVLNVALIFILAILFVARTTNSYTLGLLSSLFSVFWVNYAYTYPFMALNFTLSGYPLTFIGMALISGFTSSITIHSAKQNQLLQEKDHMLMEAEKETMRANLLRAISHDLRTPLTTILGTSSAYLSHGESLTAKERRSMVQNIYSDADWLLQMVENLLSVTRIQDNQGVTHVAKSEEPLEEVVYEAVQRFRRRFPQSLVTISIPSDLVLIPMDATLIEQVLINLLENAHYHAPSSLPTQVNVTLKDEFAVFSVRDHGPGIDPQLLDRLFDGGSITKETGSDAHKGMGIGLSICRTIVKAHGGEICASNCEGGAQFTFTLPDWRKDYGSDTDYCDH